MLQMKPKYICLNCRLGLRLGSRLQRRTYTASPRLQNTTARPPTAPKPVPNLKHIRENAEVYSKTCIDRNYAFLADYPAKIQTLAQEAAQLQHSLKQPRSRIKQVEKSIAKLAGAAAKQQRSEQQTEDSTSKELDALRAEAKNLKDESQQLTERREECVEEMQRLALSLPNLTSAETPLGNEPRVVKYINYDPASPPAYTSSPTSASARSHVTIGTSLGLLDFTSSATSTGWGWYFLTNEGALLEQALIQYALSVAIRRGWKPVSPPTLVYSYIAEACGFQPRDTHNEQQIWSLEQSEKDKSKPQRCLTGTAEIPLAAMYAGHDVAAEKLPIKLVGASRCYRAEAGARGVDTKGLYRVHEFTKVELFAWADNGDASSESKGQQQQKQNQEVAKKDTITSDTLFSELLSIQTEILSSLNLPCRVLEMPSSDLGASAARKQDIEVLFPSRISITAPNETEGNSKQSPAALDENGWGEVTSASICTDYQSRRLGTRVRGATSSRFPHTVNGTAMAVPRVLAAILENGWDDKLGGVVVPEVLRPWMMGIEVIKGQDK